MRLEEGRDGAFWAHPEGLDPVSFPGCCFPFPASLGLGAAFVVAPCMGLDGGFWGLEAQGCVKIGVIALFFLLVAAGNPPPPPGIQKSG